MPVSRKRKKNIRPINSNDPHKIVFNQIRINDGDHAEFRAAIIEAARKGVEGFPKLVGRISDLFQSTYPAYILSTFAFYGCHGVMDDKGHRKALTSGILQHHIELLQALAAIMHEG